MSAGAASTHSWLPRRSRSQPSSEVRQRTATSTRTTAGVRVDVARGDRRDVQRLGEVAELRVPARVAALVRPLQLDEEARAAERAGELRRRVRVADGE